MQQLRFEELGGRVGRHHIAVTRLRRNQTTWVHTHDFVELFLVERGRGWHRWNGRDLPLEHGSLVFVHADDVHCYRSAENTELIFINLAIEAEWWRDFLRLLPEGLHVDRDLAGEPRGHVRLDAASARAAAELLHDLLERGATEPLLLPAVVASLVARLLRPAAPAITETAGAPEWLVGLVRDFHDPDLVPRPIGFWQRRAGVSAEHLARTCRRFLGEPPTVLLNRARIDLVKTRLRQGEDKIAALALDAGFQNLGFFYRCFRQFTGCTPREWLAKHAAKVTVPH